MGCVPLSWLMGITIIYFCANMSSVRSLQPRLPAGFTIRVPVGNSRDKFKKSILERTGKLDETTGIMESNITQLSKLIYDLADKLKSVNANQNAKYGIMQSNITEMSKLINVLTGNLKTVETYHNSIGEPKIKCASMGYKFVPYVNLCIMWSVSTDLKNWTDSKATCESQGARLVNMETAEKQIAVQNVLNTNLRRTYRFWVGLKKIDTPGNVSFRWTGGSSVVDGHWGEGEPDPIASQTGVQLLPLGLSDMYGHSLRQYICEKTL